MKKSSTSVSKQVMDKVVAFEKKRSSFFLWNYRVLLGFIVICLASVGAALYWELTYRNAFDLLTLFFEDREIIAEYWQDTLGTFFYEMPMEYVLYLVLSIVVIFIIVFMTKPIRNKVNRMMQNIAKMKNDVS